MEICSARCNLCCASKAAPHKHTKWEIIVCTNGHCELHVGDRYFLLVPQSILVLPPNSPHYAENFHDFCETSIIVDSFPFSATDSVLYFLDDKRKTFTLLADILCDIAQSNEPRRIIIMSCLWEVLCQLICSWSALSNDSVIVRSIRQALEDNIANPDFCLTSCLADTGFCPDYARRCFKREMGCSPQEYFSMLRIRTAQKMLMNSDLNGYTVKQIAYLSGFADPYYFSKLFRKLTGTSPSEYIAMCKKKEL